MNDDINLINTHKNLITLLTNLGYDIVFIDQEFFIIDTFVTADSLTLKHTLKGKNLNKFFQHFASINIIQNAAANQSQYEFARTEIVNYIMNLPLEYREYSNHFIWRKFLSL